MLWVFVPVTDIYQLLKTLKTVLKERWQPQTALRSQAFLWTRHHHPVIAVVIIRWASVVIRQWTDWHAGRRLKDRTH